MEGKLHILIPCFLIACFITYVLYKSDKVKKEKASVAEKLGLYKNAMEAFKAENYEEALEKLSHYINKDKGNAEAYFHRGIVHHLHEKDYYEAISDYNNAIKLKSDKASYYYKRGLAKEALKNYTHASDDFQKAIELDSKSTEAILSYYELSIIKLRKCVSSKDGNIAPEIENNLGEARLKYIIK